MIAALLGTLVLLAPASPRERIRFDADWRFFREAAPPESQRGPFAWQWKVADVESLDGETLPADVMAGDWKTTQLGENTLGATKDRFAWYRTDLGRDPDGAKKSLRFESVDDNAVVFLNGKRLAKHLGFGVAFSVPVAEAWREDGSNTLVVLVENTAAGGGINGGVDLESPEDDAARPEMARNFDDAKWRVLHLPHDYVVEGTFDPKGDVGHGSLPKPVGLYRKTFTPPETMRGKSVWIDFDGVYRNSTVYLNGEKLGTQPSGYMGFRYDLSKKLEYGKPNVIALTVAPRQNEGWWYEGGGIYRHVWLNVADPLHIAPDGVFVRSTIDADKADVKVDVSLQNAGAAGAVDVRMSVVGPQGNAAGSLVARNVSVAPDGTAKVTGTLPIRNPKRWDLETPNLYRIVVTLLRGKTKVDEVTVNFGIRDVRWDAEKGFFLNGRPVKIQGTCDHQDHAGVGIAMPDGLQEWRVQKLLEMGSNAYRTSHNPTSPEFLDACDRLGMLVLDETRHLGDAMTAKSPTGTTADDLGELKAMVRRDRNHPSVIAWSLYNEEPLQGTEEGAAIFEKMRAAVDALDGTRLSTGASNFGYDKGIVDVAALFGINYSIGVYDSLHARKPSLPLFASETSSAVSTRGIYANDPARGYVSAYDVNAPSWGATAETAWKAVAERAFMAGAFVWTGFDYKGEPTPYGWPCVNSHFGIMDIAGFPKDNYYYYKAWWGTEPVVHLLPHWNWDDGTIDVWAHSNADSVELFLNGKSLGSKDVPKYGHVEWKVPYVPGSLEARGTKGGKIVARDRVETTGPPAALRLSTDRRNILADNEDLTTVRVEVVDSKGRVVPTAGDDVRFEIAGAGRIGGVGNGDPSDHDPDKADHRKAFNGLCMVLVQSNGTKGRITLRASAEGLKGATITLDASGGVISQ